MPANPATPPPVLIAVNGGGWLGTNEDDLNVFGGAKALTDLGFAVVSIRYTVAAGYNADHTFNPSWDPKTLPQDVDKAIRWARAYAGTLGVDPNRVPGDDHGLSGLDHDELVQFLSYWKPDIAPDPPAPPEGSCN